jgi:hypothetical protein
VLDARLLSWLSIHDKVVAACWNYLCKTYVGIRRQTGRSAPRFNRLKPVTGDLNPEGMFAESGPSKKGKAAVLKGHTGQ